jgi:hypothetical protein
MDVKYKKNHLFRDTISSYCNGCNGGNPQIPKKLKKPKKRKKQQQIGKTKEEHMPQSTPSTAACRIPLCAILQLPQLKIDLKKNSLPHINEDP